MPNTKVSFKRSRQPQIPVPAADNIPQPSLLWNAAHKNVFWDRDRLRPVRSETGGISSGVAKGGTYTQAANGADYTEFTQDGDRYLSTTGGSALLVMERTGGGMISTGFAFGTFSTSSYRFGCHVPWSDNTIYWDFGGVSAPNRVSAAYPSGDDVKNFVFTAGQDGMRIFCNGALLASSTTAATRGNPTGCYLGLGIDNDSGGSIVGRSDNAAKRYGFVVWPEQLRDSLARELSLNPWKAFAKVSVPGSFTTGTGPTYTLTANSGGFTLTGVASSLLASRLLTASAGSFVLTGQAAGLKANRVLAANVGSFTLDGKNVNILFNRKLTAATGGFALTGNVANLVYTPVGITYTLTAETGNFNLNGQVASLLANRVLTAQTGDFDLVGNDAGLYVVVPGTGPVLYLDLISKKVMLLQRLD